MRLCIGTSNAYIIISIFILFLHIAGGRCHIGLCLKHFIDAFRTPGLVGVFTLIFGEFSKTLGILTDITSELSGLAWGTGFTSGSGRIWVTGG